MLISVSFALLKRVVLLSIIPHFLICIVLFIYHVESGIRLLKQELVNANDLIDAARKKSKCYSGTISFVFVYFIMMVLMYILLRMM